MAHALSACRTFLTACDEPLRVFPTSATSARIDKCTDAGAQLGAICAQLELPALLYCNAKPPDVTSLDVALSRYLELDQTEWSLDNDVAPSDALDQSRGTPSLCRITLRRGHGEDLTVYRSGSSSKNAVLLVPPCGVPAPALWRWLQHLGTRYLTVTWESPSMFGAPALAPVDRDPLLTIINEIIDVVAGFRLSRVHLIGICGGAPPALLAAVQMREAVSVSICHGDVKVGEDSPRTPFQHQFHSLLADSRDEEAEARSIYQTMLDPNLALGVPAALGPFVLYPYARLDLFRRYALINTALMEFDVEAVARSLACPVLVLTSSTDRMAHPGASRALAAILRRGELHERESGDHLDVLLGNEDILETVANFLERA